MKIKTRVQKKKKDPSPSYSPPVETGFGESRPFGVQGKPEEMPDVQPEMEKAQRLSHNVNKIQVSDRTAVQPKLTIKRPGEKEKPEDSANTAIANVLSEKETSQLLKSLPDWTTNGIELHYTREFQDSAEANNFVQLVEKAQKEAGHPADIDIKDNQVAIALTTHEGEGLTEKDFQLAEAISQLNLEAKDEGK